MRALSTSPMASVNLRFDKNFGFSPYGNICTCFPEIVYFSTRNMLPKTSKVFTCENGEDCLNLNGAKYAKLVDLEKGPSVAKMEIDTADNGPLRKNSTRFSSDFRVRLAANAATQPENVRECRHETGCYHLFLQQGAKGPETQTLRCPLPICVRRTRPASFD